MALLALRHWWAVVATAVVLGAVVGVVAGARAPYVATTLLRVDVKDTDQTANAQTLQTAVQFVDNDAVYDTAARATSTTPGDLRLRTKVALLDSAPIVSVTVTADDGDEAVTESTAITDAVLQNLNKLSGDQFSATRALGQHAVYDGTIDDPPAEQARRQAIGTVIATQQGAALGAASLLTRINTPQEATRSGLTGPTAIAVGVLCGLLFGCLVALLLNKRGRVRRLRDVGLAGEIDAYERREAISRVVSRCVAVETPLVGVLAMPGLTDDGREYSDELRSELRGEGLEILEVNSADVDLSRRMQDEGGTQQVKNVALALPKRAKDLAVVGADVMVFLGVADGVDVARMINRAETVLLIAVRRVTRIGDLRRVHEQLVGGGVLPIVVVADATA
jgi:hypothetical protein